MLNRWCGPSRFVFPVVLGLLLAVCGGTTGTGTGTDGKFTGTINIASSTWTGYAIIYIANAKETWKSHGLDVKFSDVEDPNDRLIALTAGRLEGMASTVDAFARAQSNGVPAVEVFPIDASVGGDGILAKNTIKTVQDLKGQKVAVNQGSVSEWFLAQVLQKNGLKLADVSEQAGLPVHGSIGVAAVTSDDLDSPEAAEDLLRRADEALYNAKRSGRDRVEVAPVEH